MSPIHRKLPERIAPLGAALRTVHAHVASGAREAGEVVYSPCACRGAVNACPIGRVVGHLNLVGFAVCRFPSEFNLVDVVGAAEVDIDPLGIAELRRPAGAEIAIECVTWESAVALYRTCSGWFVEGNVS